MFGIVTAHLSRVGEEEKARYRAVYCGLCRALKERYGQVSRVVLTYDLTFFILLANSLHEPPEQRGEERCAAHPMRKMPYARSPWTDYAADLAVALAYHKCLDDVRDESSAKARAGAALLARSYERARERIPEQCAAVERSMAAIARIEGAPGGSTPGTGGGAPSTASAPGGGTPNTASASGGGAPNTASSSPGAALAFSPDAAAIEFGALTGELFAHDQGVWAAPMRTLGSELGRFIYLMDAAVDYADDARTGSYNPLVRLEMPPENMKTLLSVLIGNAAATFEKLPLVQDIHLMRSVLYSGVWQKFNETYGGSDEGEGEGANARAGAGTRANARAHAGTRAEEGAAEKEHHD